MRKLLLLLVLVPSLVWSQETRRLYITQVKVAARKANGKHWDALGGSPDLKIEIYMRVKKGWKQIFVSRVWRNCYNMPVPIELQHDFPVGEKVKVHVIDKDLRNNDLIGHYTFRVLEDAKEVKIKFSGVTSFQYLFSQHKTLEDATAALLNKEEAVPERKTESEPELEDEQAKRIKLDIETRIRQILDALERTERFIKLENFTEAKGEIARAEREWESFYRIYYGQIDSSDPQIVATAQRVGEVKAKVMELLSHPKNEKNDEDSELSFGIRNRLGQIRAELDLAQETIAREELAQAELHIDRAERGWLDMLRVYHSRIDEKHPQIASANQRIREIKNKIIEAQKHRESKRQITVTAEIPEISFGVRSRLRYINSSLARASKALQQKNLLQAEYELDQADREWTLMWSLYERQIDPKHQEIATTGKLLEKMKKDVVLLQQNHKKNIGKSADSNVPTTVEREPENSPPPISKEQRAQILAQVEEYMARARKFLALGKSNLGRGWGDNSQLRSTINFYSIAISSLRGLPEDGEITTLHQAIDKERNECLQVMMQDYYIKAERAIDKSSFAAMARCIKEMRMLEGEGLQELLHKYEIALIEKASERATSLFQDGKLPPEEWKNQCWNSIEQAVMGQPHLEKIALTYRQKIVAYALEQATKAATDEQYDRTQRLQQLISYRQSAEYLAGDDAQLLQVVAGYIDKLDALESQLRGR